MTPFAEDGLGLCGGPGADKVLGMTLTCSYRVAVCTIALLLACGPESGATSVTTEAGSDGSSGDTAVVTGGSSGSTGALSGDTPATTGEGTTGAGTTTGSDSLDTGTGALATASGVDDTGMAVPAECVEMDPTVAAGFSFDVEGVPIKDLGLLVDSDCTIVGVTTEVGVVSTEMTCDIEGEMKSVVFGIAEAPEGPVVWEQGDSVHVFAFYGEDLGVIYEVVMRAPGDDALLAYATDSENNEGVASGIKPLTVEVALVCDVYDAPAQPARLDFKNPQGQELGLFSAHRGLLAIDDTQGHAIDVAYAEASGPHLEQVQRMLVRHVITGG